MRDYALGDLVFPTSVIFVVVLVLAFGFTKAPMLSLVAATIKAGLFLVNFAFSFTGQVTGFDDLYYLDTAYKLAQGDFSFADLILRRDELRTVVASAHVVYPLHNFYSILVFDDHYFAPVALNVLLTSAVALVGMRLASGEFGLTRSEARGFFFVLLLYPEMLAWSTVFNGKETLVLIGHVLMLLGVSKLLRGRITSAVAILAPTIFILAGLRFYVPPLFVLSFLLYSLSTHQVRHRGKILIVALVAFGVVVVQQQDILGYGITLIKTTFVNPVVGLVRFLLTPIPFRTYPEYAFLNWPSVYHWLAFPLFLIGFSRILQTKTPFSRFVVIYFFVFVTFYSVFAELQGSRQRLQLAFVFALCEYRGVLVLLRAALRLPANSPQAVSA